MAEIQESSMEQAEVLDERFRIIRPLGAGGGGTVSLAEDLRRPGSRVALKLVHAPAAAARAARAEFGHLARLRHPHLIRALDFGRLLDGRLYLCTSFLEGESLRAFAKRSDERALGQVLVQVGRALDYLHRRGIIHGDIKPENILVGEGPQAVLVDLGVAHLEGVRRRSISGTLRYLAPEILAGGRASAAADLFSLGAALLEVLPSTSLLLDLARWLVAQDPGQRPTGAAAFLREVGHRLDLDTALSPAERAGVYFPEAPLVGRDDLLAHLEQLSQGVVLIRGEAGVGKSRLFEELRVRALLAGRDCVVGERSAFGGPVHELWPTLQLGGGTPAGLDPEREGLDSKVDRLMSALDQRAMVGARPLVLLDGVAADDELSLRTLERLIRSRVACCATVTDEEWGALHRRLVEKAGIEVHDLHGLSVSQSKALLEGLLDPGIADEEMATAVHSASGGNPRLIEELVRAGIESGMFVDGRYHVEGGRTSLDALARARLAHLDEALRGDLQRVALFVHGVPLSLAPPLNRLRERGLVAESEGIVRVVNPWLKDASLILVPEDDRAALHLSAAEALLELEERTPMLEVELAEQLARGGREWEAAERFFDVARQSDAAFDLSTASRLLQRSVALIEADRRADPVHRMAIERRALGELARRLRVAGDYTGARAVDEHRLALAGDDRREVVEARLGLAETVLGQGEGEAAIEALGQILSLASADRRSSIRCLWARALVEAGRYLDAELQISSALDEGEHPPGVEADLRNMSGICSMMRGAPMSESLASFDHAASLHAEAGDRRGMARSSNSRGILLQRGGDLDGAAAAYRECLELARQVGDIRLQLVYTENLGTVAQELLRYADALAAYREGLSLAQAIGHERELARLSANLGNLMVQIGDLTEAHRLLDRASEIAARLGLEELAAYILLYSGELALYQRDLEQACALSNQSHRRFEALGNDSAAGVALVLVAVALREAGEIEAAGRIAAQLAGMSLGATSLARARLIEGEILLQQGAERRPRGRDRLEEAVLWARRSRTLDVLWVAHRRLGEVSESAIEREYHVERARVALAELSQAVPAPYRPLFEAVHVGDRRLPPPPVSRSPDRAVLDLLRINRELTRERQTDRILDLILDRAIDLVGAERGFIILTAQGKLSVAAARNIDQEALRRKGFKFSRSVAEKVVRTGEPVVTESATDDERFRDVRSVHEMQLRSVVCVPLNAPDGVLGALYLDNRFRGGAFSGTEVETLRSFADQAAIALTNARLLEETERRAMELAAANAEVERLNAQLHETVQDQAERLEVMSARLSGEQEELLRRYRASRLRGRSKAMCEILRLVDRVAGTDVPVLLQGETGTGKEVIAKAIHYASGRRGGPFVSVNCAAIPGPLLESELFGHARGAFTGAVRDRAGLFQVAAGGTLLLDEVGDMPTEMQAKLLRVLQEGKYRRVGEEHERDTDARIVSASLHVLSEMVAAGRFRQDLYFRLNVVPIVIPPLRDRPEDIPELVELTLSELDSPPEVEQAAMALLLRHTWPGNVRELQNELHRAAALGDGVITVETLSSRLRRPASDLPESATLQGVLAVAEKEAIERALERTGGSVTRAAQILGVSRVVFHRKMKRYGVRRVRAHFLS